MGTTGYNARPSMRSRDHPFFAERTVVDLACFFFFKQNTFSQPQMDSDMTQIKKVMMMIQQIHLYQNLPSYKNLPLKWLKTGSIFTLIATILAVGLEFGHMKEFDQLMTMVNMTLIQVICFKCQISGDWTYQYMEIGVQKLGQGDDSPHFELSFSGTLEPSQP